MVENDLEAACGAVFDATPAGWPIYGFTMPRRRFEIGRLLHRLSVQSSALWTLVTLR